jgi:hypothetical protein
MEKKNNLQQKQKQNNNLGSIKFNAQNQTKQHTKILLTPQTTQHNININLLKKGLN